MMKDCGSRMEDWKRVPLGAFAESVEYGVTASASDQLVGPKFLRITDIQDGSVEWETVPWCICDTRSASKAKLKVGDIVFARTGATTGKSYLIRECPIDSVFASYLIRVRLGEDAEPRFVSHYFQTESYWSQITKSARGVAQPGVNATTLKALEIPLPPLSEQRRIAEILDRAEALRAKRRAALAELDSLTQSLFLDLFGKPKENPKKWPFHRLMDICSPKQWPTISTPQLTETGFPVFGANGLIGYYTKYNHEDPTVLITCRGATCGTINVSPPKCYVTGNAMALDNPDPKRLTIQYLEAVLRMREMTDTISGTAQPQITRQNLEHVTLPVPPIALQREFARRVAAVERLKTAQRASLAELDALFATLQHRAFRGEL